MTTKTSPARKDSRDEAREDKCVAALAAVLRVAGSTDTIRVTVSGTFAVHGSLVSAHGEEATIHKTHLDLLVGRGLIELLRDEHTGPFRKLSTYLVTERGQAALDEWMERRNP